MVSTDASLMTSEAHQFFIFTDHLNSFFCDASIHLGLFVHFPMKMFTFFLLICSFIYFDNFPITPNLPAPPPTLTHTPYTLQTRKKDSLEGFLILIRPSELSVLLDYSY